MRHISDQTRSLSLLLALFLLFGATAFAQDEAGEAESESGTKIIRIGVLLPKVNLVEATGDVAPEEALRNTYASLLNSDRFELIALESRLTSLALDEAKKHACDFILNIELTQEQSSSGGGLFGKVLRDTGKRATYETSRKVPYGGNTGERIAGTTVRSTVINTGYTMSDMSVTVKKKDKFTLDYNLTRTATGDVLHQKQFEEKAKKNNDPVLMELIERSANDMVAVLTQSIPQ